MGKFVVVLYNEIKDYGIFGVQLFSHNVSNVFSDGPRLAYYALPQVGVFPQGIIIIIIMETPNFIS